MPSAYPYLLGLYLGDGCLSAYPRGVYKLRIHLDLAHPAIIDACEESIRQVAPSNRVHRRLRRSNYTSSKTPTHVEVSCYSKRWPLLFPQHGAGAKHRRPIVLADWQQQLVAEQPEALLRGMIHSDGCRFINSGTNWRYPRYSFSNRSEDILGIFRHACDLLGVHHTRAPHTVYVSRKADVDLLDRHIGPKA